MSGSSTPAWKSRNFLRQITLLHGKAAASREYPFNIPAIGGLESLEFDQPVTFFVGENGCGKSTLLEAIAVAWELNPEGGSRNFTFSTRASHSNLSDSLRLTRGMHRAGDGFFFRAESFFNLATQVDALGVVNSYGGRSLHEQSHGESFFAFFMHRMRGDGFYVFDEPEAALSPSRQLSFLSRLHELVADGCQFLIATHSPILMAYPLATIYLMDDGPPRAVPYRETEHYTVTRNFLTRTEQMLDVLLDRTKEPEA